MRRFGILVSVLLALSASAQINRVDSILRQTPQPVSRIKVEQSSINRVYLKTPFANDVILDTAGLSSVKANAITAVSLVYTRYKLADDFDQARLNRKRLLELQRFLPEAFTDSSVEWNLIEQRDGADAESASTLFHGFVVYVRPKLSIPPGFTTEVDYFSDILKLADSLPVTCAGKLRILVNEKKLPSPSIATADRKTLKAQLLKEVVFPKIRRGKKLHGTVEYRIRVNEHGNVDSVFLYKSTLPEEFIQAVATALEDLPSFNPSTCRSGLVTYEHRIMVQFTQRRTLGRRVLVTVSAPRMLSLCPDDVPAVSELPWWKGRIYDSTVFKAFERNPRWDKMLVVCDFTGSMSPYTAQLALWYQLSFNAGAEKVKHFVFFNDGDSKLDKFKRVGHTGGIYSGKAKDMSELKRLAHASMKGGFGGDIEENNVEALLAAIKACPDCKDVVMIADNYATPRDMKLIKQVNRPVKVILCGTQRGINTAYLDLVRANGGSLHTMESDLFDLTKLNEGQSVTIDGIAYKIVGGMFQRLSTM